jgi:hypothetical protein
MKRVIEIDDGTIPEGYEPVAFRVPKENEVFHRSVPVEARLILRKTSSDVNAFDQGTTVLVSNLIDGPYVNRVLVSVIGDRDYPFVCESISHHYSHECWRFAKKVVR